MLSISSRRIFFGPQKTLAFGSIGATYTPIGTPIELPAREVFINNLTNTSMTFTTNPDEDQVTLAAGQLLKDDITANRMDDHGAFQPANTQWYVKYVTAPASGAVYIFYKVGKDN